MLYKQQAFLHPETTPPAFLLDLAAKDLELITALAAEVGARMDLTEAGRRLMDEARAAGLGQSDMSVLAEYLRRQPGTAANR